MPNIYRPNPVVVTLVYGTQPLDTASFSIPLIIATGNFSATDTQIFTSAKSMLSAGISPESPAYTMASLLFQGLGRPQQVVLGQRKLDTYEVIIPEVEEGFVFSITLYEGSTTKTFSYTALVSDIADGVATALKTAITADSIWNAKITATLSTNKVVLTPVVGSYVDVSSSTTVLVARKTTASILTTVADIEAENNSWFWIVSDSHVAADVLAVAAIAEAEDRIYVTSSQDIAIRDKTADNLLQQLTALGYRNTCFGLWSPTADKTFPEAGVVGAICNVQPGTTTMQGKTITGVPVNQLTDTQLSNIYTQNGNIYTRKSGAGFYQEGFMVNGDFMDTIHHALWFKARTGESVFGLMKRDSDLQRGIRMTDAGFARIRQAIYNSPINVGILNGSIMNEVVQSEDTGVIKDLRPVVSMPSRADIPTNDLASRTLNGVKVEYVYAGFVHNVDITVYVLLDREASA